jgi:hypothetical protein
MLWSFAELTTSMPTMKLYTFSDARQQFSKILDTAKKEGKVLIRRRDGSLFSQVAEKTAVSPFDVEGVSAKVTTSEILDVLRSERERTSRER